MSRWIVLYQIDIGRQILYGKNSPEQIVQKSNQHNEAKDGIKTMSSFLIKPFTEIEAEIEGQEVIVRIIESHDWNRSDESIKDHTHFKGLDF